MLGLLRLIFRKIKSQRLKAKLYQQLDVGDGTRITLSNLDGMFPHLIHIGENCIFAPNSMVLAHDASYFLFTGQYRVAPVFIGDNCFVGFGAVIMPGIKVGNNVVIGAGSVVTKDVSSDSVVAGVPAKVITSLSEYLQKRIDGEMFAAPYAGMRPCEVGDAEIANFRRLLYPKIRNDQS